MRLQALPFVALLVPLAVVTCTASTDQGTIQILTVDDPFVGPPAAAVITVQSIAYDDGGAGGAVTTLASGPGTQGSINLGTYDESDTESLRVTAVDDTQTPVAWGETLPIQLGAVAGLSIGVFVQRVGALSRMPTALGDGRTAPLLNIVGGRYVFVSGGTDSSVAMQTRLYDLIAWAPLASPPALSFAPESMVIAQPTEGDFQALAINAAGAQWYDLTDADTDDASAPSGAGSWADVAGGVTITDPGTGTSYVVGGTRTSASGAPTTTVLVVSASGALSWAGVSGLNPRLGATATYVSGLGLVIEGGNAVSADGGAPPGVEYLVDDANWAPLQCPSDTTTGAGMVVLGSAGATSSQVLVVGGASASGGGTTARVLTISTTSPCTSQTWQPTLPTPLAFTQVFDIDASNVFVVGEDASGAMHAYTLSATTAVEIPFRLPRSHARAVRLPIGAPGAGPIAVVGGDQAGGFIESFIPQGQQ